MDRSPSLSRLFILLDRDTGSDLDTKDKTEGKVLHIIPMDYCTWKVHFSRKLIYFLRNITIIIQ